MNRSLVFSFFGRDVSAGSTMGKLGRNASTSAGHLNKLGTALGAFARRAAVAGGAIGATAAYQVLKIGMAYQDSLNIFKAVSHATAAQMVAVGVRAKLLGQDMSLPATSAADAAAAMTELAKGGLKVRDSMAAAKGTLQLATAATVDGATAAQIQVNALNQFGLKGRMAGHVADLLANAANSASGEIVDMAEALKYIGPVAHSSGVSLDDTATAIALLAKNGQIGSIAGTGLRGMLVSLQSPSAKGAKALHALGVNAYDSRGKFVGLRKIVSDLSIAQRKYNQQAFAKLTADAFQKRNLSAINILAREGAKGFDSMAGAVTRSGGAAAVSQAKMQGLHGAFEGLKSQLETTAITIYQRFAPGLERMVRGLAGKVGPATDGIVTKLASFGRTIQTQVLPTLSALARHAIAFGQTLWPIVAPLLKIGGAIVLGGLRAVGGAMGFMSRHATTLKVVTYTLVAAFVAWKAVVVAAIVQERIEAASKWLQVVSTRSLTKATTNQRAAMIGMTAASRLGAVSAGALAGSVGVAAAAIVGVTLLTIHATKREDQLARSFNAAARAGDSSFRNLAMSYANSSSQMTAATGHFTHMLDAATLQQRAALESVGFSAGALTSIMRTQGAAAAEAYISSFLARWGSGIDLTTTTGQSVVKSQTLKHQRLDAQAATFAVGTGPVKKTTTTTATTHVGASANLGGFGGGGGAALPAGFGGGGGGAGGGGGGGGGSSAAVSTKLKRISKAQGLLLARGIFNSFAGAAGTLLGKLPDAVQTQLNSAAHRVETAMTRMANRVKASRAKLATDLKAKRDDIASIRDSLLGGADITGVFGTDDQGNSTVGNISSFLSGQLSTFKSFLTDVSQLRKMGLSPALLRMIVNAGPVQGDQLARQIISGQSGGVAGLNATEASISSTAGKIGGVVGGAAYDKRIAEDRKHLRQTLAEQKKQTRLLHGIITAILGTATTPDGLAKALRKLKRELGHDLGLA